MNSYYAQVRTKHAIWYKALVIDRRSSFLLAWHTVDQHGVTKLKTEVVSASAILSIRELL